MIIDNILVLGWRYALTPTARPKNEIKFYVQMTFQNVSSGETEICRVLPMLKI